MLGHGSHLLDLARYLGGPIKAVDARLRQKFGAYCWFIDVDFENGALGHLDLTLAVRNDWREDSKSTARTVAPQPRSIIPGSTNRAMWKSFTRRRDNHARSRRRWPFLPPTARRVRRYGADRRIHARCRHTSMASRPMRGDGWPSRSRSRSGKLGCGRGRGGSACDGRPASSHRTYRAARPPAAAVRAAFTKVTGYEARAVQSCPAPGLDAASRPQLPPGPRR